MKAIRRDAHADPPGRAPLLFVHTDAQWECLRSPVRHEIVQFLASLGACSIAELAHAMDTAADGLYHHVNRLLEAGLIRVAGDRHTGRRRERLYDLAAERMRLDIDVATSRNTNRLRQVIRARLAHAEEAIGRGLRARAVRIEEPLADSVIDAGCAWLDDESFQRVLKHIQGVRQIMSAGRRRREGRLCSLTIVFNPTVRARAGARKDRRFAAAEPAG